MNILIIEDEVNAFEYLKTIIHKIKPEVNILANIESVEDAVNWFHQNKQPDLIFLDIQLSDGLSFEIFKHVELKSPVIFTTAYDQYAIEAFKVNSIDYLLKPIHPDDLKRAMKKFEQHHFAANSDLSARLEAVFRKVDQPKKNRCLVSKGDHYEFINIKDIAFANSEDGLTFLNTFSGKKHLYSSTIEGFMSELDPLMFFQINRAQVVNINAIQKIHMYFNQRLILEVTSAKNDMEFIVSRTKVAAFKKWADS